MDISFIIPNYKSENYLARCVESIKNHVGDVSHEIIIINNDDKPVIDIWKEDRVIIINNKTNKGFAEACNKGAKISNGEFLFFLNPDTEIKSGNIQELLTPLVDCFVGITAPQLVLPSGEVQPWSAGSKITLWDILRNNFGSPKSKSVWNCTVKTEADWVSGAGFVITKILFESLGGFDEKFFMYFEDADLCKRVVANGKKIFLIPSVQVLHFCGQSATDKTSQKKQYYASQDYYFEKHFGSFQLFLLRSLRSISLFLK